MLLAIYLLITKNIPKFIKRHDLLSKRKSGINGNAVRESRTNSYSGEASFMSAAMPLKSHIHLFNQKSASRHIDYDSKMESEASETCSLLSADDNFVQMSSMKYSPKKGKLSISSPSPVQLVLKKVLENSSIVHHNDDGAKHIVLSLDHYKLMAQYASKARLKPRIFDCIDLRHVLAVTLGKNTNMSPHEGTTDKDKDIDGNLCFSLVTEYGNYDFQCSSSAERDSLAGAISDACQEAQGLVIKY